MKRGWSSGQETMMAGCRKGRSLPLGYQVEHLLSVAGRQRSAFHGLMSATPAAWKALVSRVATAKPREAAIAAI